MGIQKQFRQASSWALVSLIMGGFAVVQAQGAPAEIALKWEEVGNNVTISFQMPTFVGDPIGSPGWAVRYDSSHAAFADIQASTEYVQDGAGVTYFPPAAAGRLDATGAASSTGELGGVYCDPRNMALYGPGAAVELTFARPVVSFYRPSNGEVICSSVTWEFVWRTGNDFLPGNSLMHAPRIGSVYSASKGMKNSVNLGNSGFAPVGNGMMIGVGYDRADNSLTDDSVDNYNGDEYRIHLDLLKGNGHNFYGLAGEYRKAKYTIAGTTNYETNYYGPRVDLGRKFRNGWVQLSGAYLFGKAKIDGVKGDSGHLIQAGLLAQMDKRLRSRLTLQPGVDVQYIWQKLGTIDSTVYDNRDYGRADFNLGLAVALNRGWSITPNVGYRWDIQAVCTQVSGGTKTCEPKASGVRFGVRAGKAIMATGSKFDKLSVSAYYDYFKKSGIKQSVWGVLAQYPF